MTKNKYFGTDGIRGRFGQYPMTTDFVYRLGVAAGRALKADKEERALFVIGRDTRVSGPILQKALAAGLRESGARVLDLGILPTPGIAYLTRYMGATAGAVISASHNPAAENGIKFLSAEGMKLTPVQEEAIEAIIDSLPDEMPDLEDKCLGEDSSKLFEVYLQDILTTVPGLDLSRLRILLDCSNGAAHKAGPEVLERLGADLVAINTKCDGVNINLHAGSENLRSRPEELAKILKGEKADLAIAFDGDADRVIMMDEKGNLIDGDHMLALLADELHRQGRLLGDTMVTTVMANGALKEFAKEKGFNLLLTPVGDKYVTEELMNLAQKEESKGMLGLGGEQSGHIILLDEEHRTGDGIRTAVFILKMLAQMPDPSLCALAGSIQKYNQVVASCDVSSKPDLQSLTAFQERLGRLQTDLPGLVQWNSRYSGTEPKYRLMLEADTRHSAGEVAAIAWEICDLIQSLTNTPKGAKIEVLNVTQGGLMPRPE